MVIFEEKQFLQELEYLVNIDSGSGTADGIGQIASFLIGKCSQLGLTVKKHVFDPAYGPCLEVRNYPESEDIDLLLLCHMDTVFPVGTSEKRPFRIKGDQVYGPGCADMKSSILLAFALVQNLLRERPELRLCVALNSDSEVGSISSRGKSAHSGVDPRGGASAVLEMANWICRFADFDRLPLGTSLNFGVARGGTMYNVIPDYAESSVDIRFETEEQYEILTEEIRSLCDCPYNPEIRVTAECLARSYPMVENQSGQALIALMEQEAAQLGIPVNFAASGGASDASIPSQEGVGTIDACGPIGFNLHNDDEHILLSSVRPRLALLLAVCNALPIEKLSDVS